MPAISIHSEEFADAVAQAGLRARQEALAAGHAVVFLDDFGRYVEELPDGRCLEIRFEPGAARDSHVHVLRELPTPAG
jgi:hypothetical protein